jgi:hypothetical protein
MSQLRVVEGDVVELDGIPAARLLPGLTLSLRDRLTEAFDGIGDLEEEITEVEDKIAEREILLAKLEERIANREDCSMTGIEIKIPVGLTAAHIQQVNPAIDEAAAEALASELHAIIAAYRRLFSVRAPGDPGEHASEEDDMVLTLWRMALGIDPRNFWTASEQGVWVMCRLEAVGDDETLYRRWLKVGDRILGSNLADDF